MIVRQGACKQQRGGAITIPMPYISVWRDEKFKERREALREIMENWLGDEYIPKQL